MGGKGVLDKDTLNLLRISNELDIVTCYIDFSDHGNFELFDRDLFLKQLQTDALDFLKVNSIKCKVQEPGDKGGGFTGNLLQIIKELWEFRDIFLFIGSLTQFIKNSFDSYLQRSMDYLKPRVEIALSIDTNTKVKKTNKKLFQSYYLKSKLSNLLNVGDALCKHLKGKYSYLSCDFSFRICTNKNNFHVNFFIPDKFLNSNNIDRILKIVEGLVFKNDFESRYSFSKWKLIVREDFEGIQPKPKKYYLIFSSKLIKDYLLKKKLVKKVRII